MYSANSTARALSFRLMGLILIWNWANYKMSQARTNRLACTWVSDLCGLGPYMKLSWAMIGLPVWPSLWTRPEMNSHHFFFLWVFTEKSPCTLKHQWRSPPFNIDTEGPSTFFLFFFLVLHSSPTRGFSPERPTFLCPFLHYCIMHTGSGGMYSKLNLHTKVGRDGNCNCLFHSNTKLE